GRRRAARRHAASGRRATNEEGSAPGPPGKATDHPRSQRPHRQIPARLILRGTLEVEQDCRFVADRPGIVSRRDNEAAASAYLPFRAISADDMQAPLNHVADMLSLTAIGLCDRLDVHRP